MEQSAGNHDSNPVSQDNLAWSSGREGPAMLDVGTEFNQSMMFEEGKFQEERSKNTESTSSRKRQRPEQQKVSLQDFEKKLVLGTGAYAKVFLVVKKSTGKFYAMKVLQKDHVLKCKQAEHTMTERKILAQPNRHPFIVGLSYAFQTNNTLNFVIDYCAGGELYMHLSKLGRFPEERAKFYCAELALALGHLHSQGVVYRDLKPENILIDSSGHIKLADFGLSKRGILRCDQGAQTFCGTPEYLAPEILQRKGHGTAVDWWSLGALLYEMLTGLPPWYSQNKQKMFLGICNGSLQFKSNSKSTIISLCAQDLIRGLLNRDPEYRLGSRDDVDEIKQHLFFAKVDWGALLHKKVDAPWKPEPGVCYVDGNTTQMPIEPVADQQKVPLVHVRTPGAGAVYGVDPPPVPQWNDDIAKPAGSTMNKAPISTGDPSPPVRSATFAEVLMGRLGQSGGSQAKALEPRTGSNAPKHITPTVPILSNSPPRSLSRQFAESCSVFDGFSYTAPSSLLARSPHLGRSPQQRFGHKKAMLATGEQHIPESNLPTSSFGSFATNSLDSIRAEINLNDGGERSWTETSDVNPNLGIFKFDAEEATFPIDLDDESTNRGSPCTSPPQQMYTPRQ